MRQCYALEAVLCRSWAPPCGATGAMPSLSPIWWSMLPLIQCYADAGPRRAEQTSAMPSLGPILWSTLSLIQSYADTGSRTRRISCHFVVITRDWGTSGLSTRWSLRPCCLDHTCALPILRRLAICDWGNNGLSTRWSLRPCCMGHKCVLPITRRFMVVAGDWGTIGLSTK